MLTITLVLGLLRVGNYFPQGGLAGLAVFCLVWGFGGAFISLALSRVMAKWMMGVKVIPPNTTDPTLRELVEKSKPLGMKWHILYGIWNCFPTWPGATCWI